MSEPPHPDGVRLLPWKRAPLAIDIVLVLITVVAVLGDRNGAGELDGRYEVIAGLITVVLILARRRYPLPALVGAVAAMGVLLATTSEPSVAMLGVLVTMHNVAASSPRRTALIVGVAVAVVFVLATVLSLDDGNLTRALVSSIAWPGLATATGMTVAASRVNMANAQERAERAEATRELEAQRRASEERLRIARDVHDVVGHHLAVINVQSGVAAHLLRSDAEAADAAIGAVRDSAGAAIDELGELLSVLRADPDAAAGADRPAPVRPTPNLAAIDELIGSFSRSGLVVEHERSGTPRSLSRSAEVAAYRVVQEALTNAHKHGDGTVQLRQRFTDAGLEIIATNSRPTLDDSAGSDAGAGFGLVGMRERLASVGGTLAVDQEPGCFEVRASIPAREPT